MSDLKFLYNLNSGSKEKEKEEEGLKKNGDYHTLQNFPSQVVKSEAPLTPEQRRQFRMRWKEVSSLQKIDYVHKELQSIILTLLV